MIDWITDWEDGTTDPQDGEGAFQIWWEDMRPREVCSLVHDAYEHGYERGRREEKAKHDKLKLELERLRDEVQVLLLKGG